MAKSLKQWIKEEVIPVKDKKADWLASSYFFRDPQRHIKQDSRFFFTPADGVIVYQERVKSHDKICQIKGVKYTLSEAMYDYEENLLDPNTEYLIVGVFMTYYDVHINRIPYSGYLSYEKLPPIESYNVPMLDMEKELMKGITNPDFNTAEYLQLNERMLNEIFAPKINQYYYVLQIGDYDVNVILPFNQNQVSPMKQNERFSMIRWGSQCDLVIPITSRYNYYFTQKVGYHVEGAIDTLVKIIPKNGREIRHYTKE